MGAVAATNERLVRGRPKGNETFHLVEPIEMVVRGRMPFTLSGGWFRRPTEPDPASKTNVVRSPALRMIAFEASVPKRSLAFTSVPLNGVITEAVRRFPVKHGGMQSSTDHQPTTSAPADPFASLRLDGRVALVTGAAGGIGAATVALLRARGAATFGVDIESNFDVHRCDVTSESDVHAAIDYAFGLHGRLDIVVNAAGVAPMRLLSDMSLELWDRVLRINLTGPFLVCRAAMPHLATNHGAIVNVASISAVQGQPANVAYTASKGGLLQLTRSLAVESAQQGVRVNAVCPGGVDTDLVRSSGSDLRAIRAAIDPVAMDRLRPLLGGLATTADVAEMIAFAVSDAARSITGATLIVDRGTTSS